MGYINDIIVKFKLFQFNHKLTLLNQFCTNLMSRITPTPSPRNPLKIIGVITITSNQC